MNDDRLYNLFFLKLKEHYKSLLKKFIIVFSVVIICSFFIDKRYTSTISVMPNLSDNNISSLGLLAQDFGINSSGASNFPIAEIAGSNSILDKIYLSSFDLDNNKGKATLATILRTNKQNIFAKIISKITNKDSNNPLLIKHNTLNKFTKERLSISYDRKTNITSISITVEDPLAAKQIAETFYNELSFFINKTINDSGKIKKNFIEKKLESTEDELFLYEKKLENFLNENKSLNDSPKLLQEYNRIRRDVTVQETAYLLLKKELESAKIDEIKNSLKLFIIQKPEKSAVKSYPSRIMLALSVSSLFIFVLFLYRIRNDIFLAFSNRDF
tara:strand:+ start:1673 stop:2659 length:987 start_codon:yes stop_codon:yes gene_type:complete